MLTDYEWDEEYRTGENDPLSEFTIPALEQSQSYWRAAGFFSSSIFDIIGKPMGDFVQRGGMMDLVTSVHLSQEDTNAIEDGTKKREDALEETVRNIIKNEFVAPLPKGVMVLANMLTVNALNIKVATKVDGGLFHPKMGVFLDENEDYVAFSGSQNASLNSMVNTFEEIDVFTSWDDPGRARKKRHWFEKLWKGEADGVVTYDFPDALRKIIVKEAKKTEEMEKKRGGEGTTYEQPIQVGPESIGVFDERYAFQEEAVDWFVSPDGANGAGLYWMATGTGKTITALKTINRLFEMDLIDSVVLNTKERLLHQWLKEMNKTLPGSDTLAAPWRQSTYTIWQTATKKQMAIFRQVEKKGKLLLITYSFLPKFVQQCIGSNTDLSRTLLIVDEVHNIGSNLNVEAMSQVDEEERLDEITSVTLDLEEATHYNKFGYRLGLSATPFSDFDDARNEFILSGFTHEYPDITNQEGWSDRTLEQKRTARIQLYPQSNCAYYFGLEDAIKRGILVPFDYLALDYEPTEQEKEDRIGIMKYWKARVSDGTASPSAPAIHMARVFKGSKDKLRAFREWLQGATIHERARALKRSLIFVDTEAFGFGVAKILHDYETKSHTFFSGSDEGLLNDFSEERLDVLITCHMISEGVSINSISSIIIFASDRQRLETIQRIGRALRRNNIDPDKVAQVLDFVYIVDEDEDTSDAERFRWLTLSSKTKGADE